MRNSFSRAMAQGLPQTRVLLGSPQGRWFFTLNTVACLAGMVAVAPNWWAAWAVVIAACAVDALVAFTVGRRWQQQYAERQANSPRPAADPADPSSVYLH